ncbi:hypothetical protein IMAU10149_00738 [Lactobacillus helveticus]|uniref:phage tail tube assembly chaperone n=1 Tax=Lactobacillus helveticus TaxID=1587 RepID=UPI0015659649|nr:phage tail tube assembly chaperone [Lactobacillus helveticus]NRO84166.1 hypothetical protein [Lactobacillus helveticus]
MSAKVNGNKLHLTTFEIPTSGKNIRKCLVAQKKFAEASETIDHVNTDDDDSMIKALDAQIKLIDTYTEFLKPILHLSDEQAKKVEDSDFNDVVDFTNEVISKILGYDSDKSKKSEDK